MEKIKVTKRQVLCDLGYEDVVVFDGPEYDSAIIGLDTDNRAVYDYEAMVEELMETDKMEYDEAVEFIEYNTVRALPYFENAPIILHRIDWEEEMYPGKYAFDAKKEKDNVVNWIRDWFDANGKGCNAVLGMSGGKDSTICAALLAEALGKERVIGVAMPDLGQGYNDAKEICEHLGIRYLDLPIGRICNEFHNVTRSLENKPSKQALQNLPPRVRMSMLYFIAQTYNGRVCCTDNLSENWLGYSTFGGDDLGAFSPLGALTVTEVRAIGDELGIPSQWVHKTPDDGLPNSSSDEAKFGFTYATLDEFIRTGVCADAETRNKINTMHANSQFKRDIIKVPYYKPDLYE